MNYLTGADEQNAEHWMREAGKVAEKALCLRAKCGTVIVKDGIIIGEGYNAPPLDDVAHRMCLEQKNPNGKPGYDSTCCMHAEWRAILDSIKRNSDKIKGSSLYFTRVDEHGTILRSGEPFCTVCSRFALDSGIAEFVLWHERGIAVYPTVEYNNLSYKYVHPAI